MFPVNISFLTCFHYLKTILKDAFFYDHKNNFLI